MVGWLMPQLEGKAGNGPSSILLHSRRNHSVNLSIRVSHLRILFVLQSLRFCFVSMSVIRAIPSLRLSGAAWTRVKERFLNDLSAEERVSFHIATLENVIYVASNAEKKFHTGNIERIRPFLDALQPHSSSMAMFANSAPFLGPLAGNVTVVLILAMSVEKYFDNLVDMLKRIRDVLPRLRQYEHLFPTSQRLSSTSSRIHILISSSSAAKSKRCFNEHDGLQVCCFVNLFPVKLIIYSGCGI